MAVVATALSFTRDYVPYERPPQPETLWTAIPRGLQSGIVNAGILDAKPITDSQTLTCTMTLPAGFGYVMADAQLTIHQDAAGQWEPQVTLEITNFYRGAPLGFSINYRQELDRSIRATDTNASMVVVQPWPTFPLVGISAGAPIIIVLQAENATSDAALAGTVDAFASFWQFDLEQIRKYPINSPQPVHAR